MNNLKKDWRAIVGATVVLLAVCLITTLAVAATNEATADRIAEQNAKVLAESMERVIPADEYIVYPSGDDWEVYEAVTGGETAGYIVNTGVFGYGGTVSVMTGISPEGEILAIEIVDCSEETPGLGQNAKNESFTGQFSGLTEAPELVKIPPTGDNQVQALTGATITSTAVVDAVTEALDIFGQLG